MSGVKELTGGEGGGSGRGSRVSARGYDFSKSGKTVPSVTNTRFLFGPRDSRSVSVDQTLATLFDTLSVECRWVTLIFSHCICFSISGLLSVKLSSLLV